MDLRFSPRDEAFRAEIRDWLEAKLPQALSRKVAAGAELSKADFETWHALLAGKGWLAGGWPKEYGGAGWSPVERQIFEEECCRVHAPRIVPFGVNMLGPVLIEFGSEEQKRHYLPRILSGQDWWCQGYSEPGAGSDLASLRTSAVREGDHYIVNGQKTWTTLGHFANRIFCLVRTRAEGKPQEGISFLLVDLDTPGIEMRPIRLIEGGHEVNEVFFTDVRVPAENLVGAENQGWTIAKFLLEHERTNIAGVGYSQEAFDKLRAMALQCRRDGRPLAENALFAARMAEVECALEAMRLTNLRMLIEAEARGAAGSAPSMMKIKGTQIRQEINDLARRALGPAAVPFPSELIEANLPHPAPEEYARAAHGAFNNRKLSIFGGSNEIQREILARQLLGM
ncbi:MAG: acyl-CoA dehydrogenase family protein [Pararhodobacter sp.]|nr:acyl-CoA dehydrogenase family protein [Pararhodobacter sp.]